MLAGRSWWHLRSSLGLSHIGKAASSFGFEPGSIPGVGGRGGGRVQALNLSAPVEAGFWFGGANGERLSLGLGGGKLKGVPAVVGLGLVLGRAKE